MIHILFLTTLLLIPSFFSVLKLTPNFRWILVSLSFAIISSLRPKVGMDFEAYERIASQNDSFVELLFYYMEPVSAVFVWLGQLVSLKLMLFLFSLVYALGVFIPLLLISKKSFLLYFVSLYCLPMGFLFSFDGIRQAGAIGLLMLSLAGASRILALAAISTHLSTFFILTAAYFIKIKQQLFVGVSIGLMISVGAYFLESFFGSVWKYDSVEASKFGGSTIMLMGCIGFVSVLLPKVFNLKARANPTSKLVSYGQFFGAILVGSTLSAFAPNFLVARLLYFFVPLTLFSICHSIENSRVRQVLRICFLIAISGIALLYWSTASTPIKTSVFGQ